MDNTELLFAAHVRELAMDFRKTERRAHYRKVEAQFDEPSQGAEMAKWDADHPFTPYITMALDDLERVVKIIRLRAPLGQ